MAIAAITMATAIAIITAIGGTAIITDGTTVIGGIAATITDMITITTAVVTTIITE